MLKYLVAGALVVLLGAGAYYFLSGEDPQPVIEQPVTQQPTTSVYATSTFSITYPIGYTVNDTYQNETVNPAKPIPGVKFSIPSTMATGTNLSIDSGVSVEWLTRARNCTADIFVRENVRATSVTDTGTTYSMATSSGAAAGNRYDEIVYAIPGSSPCTAIRYLIHSTNIGNYEPGTVREFDRSALVSEFDAIRRSLQLNSSTAPAAPSATSTQ